MYSGYIESLADLIYSEFRDDAEMRYASRNGLVRELRKNIRLLESVLSLEERQKLKNFSAPRTAFA